MGTQVQTTLDGKRVAEDAPAEAPPRKKRVVNPMARSNVYLGDSTTSLWRKKLEAEAHEIHARQYHKIHKFFPVRTYRNLRQWLTS